MIKITTDDYRYPESLKKLKNPPKKLYTIGNIKLLETPGISIIGSRNCSKYGEKMAKKFAKELSLYGLTIISGMAEGIDKIAHLECIENAGSTIAVLPSGFKNIYPESNIELYNKIIENRGLVLTEYEQNEIADSKKFIERNRIVAALAIGTLVVEGGYRSGTSITAKITKKLNKNVYCIPSSLENPKGLIPNKLIQEGSMLVTKVEDIINKYPDLKLEKKKLLEKIKEPEIDKKYRQVYDALDKEKPIHINEIFKKLDLEISEINYKLMMLELEDKIVSLPGNNYKIK